MIKYREVKKVPFGIVKRNNILFTAFNVKEYKDDIYPFYSFSYRPMGFCHYKLSDKDYWYLNKNSTRGLNLYENNSYLNIEYKTGFCRFRK